MSGCSIYGVLPVLPLRRWPTKGPDAVLDYVWNMCADLTDPVTLLVDAPTAVSVSVQPSGPGELVASRLSVSGTLMVVWLSGGVPGRDYTVNIEATTAAARTYQWDVGLLCDPTFAVFPLAPPPSTGPGAVLSCFCVGLTELGAGADAATAATA